MRFALIHAAQPAVLGGTIITVEADITRGLHAFSIVGLAGKAVGEAKNRVSAAIKNAQFEAPKGTNHKITISLAPADIKKEGPVFDVPIAVAYLLAARALDEKTKEQISGTLFVGELALDGTLRPITGALAAVAAAQREGFREVVVPRDNAEEAALIAGVTITPAHSLHDVVRHIDPRRDDHHRIPAYVRKKRPQKRTASSVRLEDVKGHENVKRGLIIAAAGRHNALMLGPPGTGKSMLAHAFRELLPPLSTEEALEVAAIHSVTGTFRPETLGEPPFRSPHHTASHTALVGGGTHPRPGEVTLAHRGVLFADEFVEFDRRCIDALREPLEERTISISRARGTATFPADFILLAAMNPNRDAPEEDMRNADFQDVLLDSYRTKLSGPIMDRIDLRLSVPYVDYHTLTRNVAKERNGIDTRTAQKLIRAARTRQRRRLTKRNARSNAEMSARDIEELITLSPDVQKLLADSASKLSLSPRSYHRLIKVARTIADLADEEEITAAHILEALQYRMKL